MAVDAMEHSHYNDVIMSAMASQITSPTALYSTVYSRRRSRKTSKLRVTGLCVGKSPGPVNSPHKGPVTRKMFPFDDVIMCFHLMTSSLSCGWPIATEFVFGSCILNWKGHIRSSPKTIACSFGLRDISETIISMAERKTVAFPLLMHWTGDTAVLH